MVGALEIVGDRNLSAQQIDEPAGNEERRDAARSFFVQGDGGVVDAAEPADSRAEQDAGLDLLLVGLGAPVGVAQRLRRGAHAVDDEVVDAALFLGLHPVVGIEGVRGVAARHLRGDLAGEVGNVEVLDPGRRRLAGEKPAPRRLDPASDRGHHAKTCNDDPPHLSHACTLAVPARDRCRIRRAAAAPNTTRAGLDAGPALKEKSVSTKAGRRRLSASRAATFWSTPFQDI